MKEIKHLFFTYRNGAVADTLRRYGIPHKMIFGLDVPAIAGIARGLKPSDELAERLWGDRDVRESRLLATYLFQVENMTEERALALAADVMTREEADMLAFRLLKRLPFAHRLLQIMKDDRGYGLAVKALEAHLA